MTNEHALRVLDKEIARIQREKHDAILLSALHLAASTLRNQLLCSSKTNNDTVALRSKLETLKLQVEIARLAHELAQYPEAQK